MIARKTTLMLLAPLGVALAAAPARAQDMTTMQRNAAGNQLGILEFCQGRGDIDGSAVAGQRKVIAMLPAGASYDAAEASGRNGRLVAPNGTETSLSDRADKGNTSVGALCKQMAANVNAATTNNPAMSMRAGAMPGMPPGMAMPPGMTMPAVPPATPPQ